MIFDPYKSHQLTGKHALLYRESLGTMLDVFRESQAEGEGDSIWSFGVTMFDELLWRQQLGLLLEVSRCVLNGSGAPHEWNALEKAAHYAVYRNVLVHLEIERDLNDMDPSVMELSMADDDLDFDGFQDDDEEDEAEDEDEQSWQEMIAAAYQEKCLKEGLTPGEIQKYLETDSSEDDDLYHWNSLLESLADEILEDRDFEMASTLMDADPEIASIIKQEMGISPDYFITTANEPDLAVQMNSIPADYFRYYYYRDDVLSELKAKPTTRAQDIMKAVPDYWLHYREQAEAEDPHLDQTRSRGGIHELELAIDAMDAIFNNRGTILPINMPNRGALPDFPDDMVVEMRGLLDSNGVTPLADGPLPRQVVGLVKMLGEYQALAAEAAWCGRRKDAIRALASNPLILSFEKAEVIYDEMAAALKDYLPERLLS